MTDNESKPGERVRRVWAMPNSRTFEIKPIREWVSGYLAKSKISVDPFSRDNIWATYTNDLNPETSADYHMEARDFLAMLVDKGVKADLVLMDPPYSPRQISECYSAAGLKATMSDTQNAKLLSECRNLINDLASNGCIVLSFGWNSMGMGRSWVRLETLMVAHGGAHNDTICVADRLASQPNASAGGVTREK